MAESAQEDPTPLSLNRTRSPDSQPHECGRDRTVARCEIARSGGSITPREPRTAEQRSEAHQNDATGVGHQDLTRRRYCTKIGERTTIPRRPRSALSDLLSNLPIARKLFLASVIPALTVLLLQYLDLSQRHDLFRRRRTAQRYLLLATWRPISSAGRRPRNGVPGFVLTSQEHYLSPTARRRTTCSTSAARSKPGVSTRRSTCAHYVRSNNSSNSSSVKEVLIDAVKAEHTDEARQYIEEGKAAVDAENPADMGRFEHSRKRP